MARHRRIGELVMPSVPLLIVESALALIFETHLAQNRAVVPRTGGGGHRRSRGTALQGTLSRIVPSADPVTRSQLVRIALPDRPERRPGMFGRADFKIGESPALAVPRAALVERGGVEGLFVVDDEGLARFAGCTPAGNGPTASRSTPGSPPTSASLPSRRPLCATVIESAPPRLPDESACAQRRRAAGRVFRHLAPEALFMLACALFGLLAPILTPCEENPQIVVPGVKVVVALPGASAEEVEELVIRPSKASSNGSPGSTTLMPPRRIRWACLQCSSRWGRTSRRRAH